MDENIEKSKEQIKMWFVSEESEHFQTPFWKP